MKHRIQSLLLSSLVLLGAPAFAQRAAMVQDRDSPGRAPYQAQEGINPSSAYCPNNFYCVITFPAVPAGNRLVITHAAAEFTNGISYPGVAYVAGPGGLFGAKMIIPGSMMTAASRTIASGPMTYYVEGGQAPQVIITGYNMITSNSAFAMISGYLVAVP